MVVIPGDHKRESAREHQSFAQSLRCAWSGLRYALKTQRNVRAQLVIGTGALALAFALKLPPYEVALVFALTLLVVFAELMNTALEFLLDSNVGTDFDPSVKIVKDVAAASVLVVALAAAVVGAAIFLPHLEPVAIRFRLLPRSLQALIGGASLSAILFWTCGTRGRNSAPVSVPPRPASPTRLVRMSGRAHDRRGGPHPFLGVRLGGLVAGLLLVAAGAVLFTFVRGVSR